MLSRMDIKKISKLFKILFACLLLLTTTCFAAKSSAVKKSESKKTESQNTTQNSSEFSNSSRSHFFLHAGLLDAGLGLKVRLSKENGVYLTFNMMWQQFRSQQYLRVPALIYLGGNNFHFLTGFTLINEARGADTKTEVAAGFNWDFNEHWGLSGMMFNPVSKRAPTGKTLLLDVRYVF